MSCPACGVDRFPCPRASGLPGHGRECYLCCRCLLRDRRGETGGEEPPVDSRGASDGAEPAPDDPAAEEVPEEAS